MSLTDEAIGRIVELIRSGSYRAGSRLPPERELAAALGISRNSMREAVKALAQAKVLDVRRGDGTYVTSLEPDLLLDGLKLAVDLLGQKSVLEVIEVRKLIEPNATALAAVRITNEQLEVLRIAVEAMKDTRGDAEGLIVHDQEFHRGIVAATGNQVLISLHDGLLAPTVRGRVWRSWVELDSVDASIREHEAMYHALLARDPELARALSFAHVTSTETWMKGAMAPPAERYAVHDHSG